jgi:hypothetical protein
VYNGAEKLVKQYEFTVKEIWCSRDGLNIYGKAFIPEGGGIFPTVIFSHGYSVTHAMLLPYNYWLARAGIASYTFDFISGNYGSKSDGNAEEMSVLTEQEDLCAVLDMVRTLSFVDPRQIYLFGMSQGALVSGLVAAKRLEQVRGLFLLSPAFMIADVSPYSAWLSPKYIADASSVHLYGSFTDYEGPVYIFHGGLDNWVPISYSQKAVREYKNAQLFTFPSEDHGFSAKSNREVADKMIEVILKEGGGHQTR